MYDAGYNVGIKGKFLDTCSIANSSTDFLAIKGGGYGSVYSNPTSDTYAVIGQDGQAPSNGYIVFNVTGAIIDAGTVFSNQPT